MPEKTEVPPIKYTKGEAIVAICEWVVKHRDIFHGDVAVTEDINNKVNENLDRIRRKVGAEDNDVLVSMIIMQLLSVQLKTFLSDLYSEDRFKPIEIVMSMLCLDAIEGINI